MRRLYLEFFYRHSYGEMLLWGALLVAFWTVCALLAERTETGKRCWRVINRLTLFAIVIFILSRTLLNRSGGSRGVSLVPFYSFVDARKHPERYRSVIANFLLFIPLGLSLPYALDALPRRLGRCSHPVRTAILCSLAFSVLIELVQLLWRLGLCETDDVIFNTLGAAAGTLAFAVERRLRRE